MPEWRSSISLGQDFIGWRQSKTTAEAQWEKAIVRQYDQANNEILSGDNPVLDRSETNNNLELKREAEGSKLHRIPKVHVLGRGGRVAQTCGLHRRNQEFKKNKSLP